nr:hypothetical protein [Butyrivibrio sp.]
IFFVFIGFFSVFYNMFIRKKVDVTAMGRSGLRTLSFRERLAESLIYVAGCAASLILAVLSYTACLSQIFHGYRGQEAVEAFTDGGNIITRISFFLGLLEDYVFGGMFKSLLLLFIVLIVIIQIVGKILDNTSGARVSLSVNISDSMKKVQLVMPSICILLLSVICYFLVVAKTALLLGATSNRYEMPVYGIIIMLVFMGLDFVLQECLMMLVKKKYKFIKMASFVCISILLLVVDIKGILLDENVLFLYPEAEERVTYAKENSDIPVIIMFNDSTPDNVWRLTDQILSYPEAYYVSEGNTEEITDETIISAEKLIVYAADHDNKEALLQMIVDSNESLEQVTERYSEEMWTMYVVE